MSDSEEDVPLKALKSDRRKKSDRNSAGIAVKKVKVKPDPAPSSPNARGSISKKRKSDASSLSSSNKKSKVKAETTSSGSDKKPGKTLKVLDKTERLQYAMQSFLWWDAPEPPEGCQWSTMEHAGVSFPEPYEPHGIKMKYDGAEVELTSVQEEAATFFAAMDPEGMHLGNPATAKIFIKNFFADFKSLLGRGHVIKDFKKCDFEPIRQHLNEQKIVRKAISDAEKKANKDGRNQVLFQFGYALVDGHLERVGNYNMEPPGAFRGRGEHPKMGKLKQRVAPEQVSLNLSEGAPIPRCPVPGHAWGDLRHDPQVQWLAQWKENINNSVKYMQLAAQSSFKGKSDRSKYNKAALLCEKIAKIRSSTKKQLKSKNMEARQLATAVWVIDRLALRVGGEKDTEEEADTVGCCSLRIEHLHFDPNEEEGDNKEIELEFLGKDSMLYKQTIDFGHAMYNDDDTGVQVFENLRAFCKKKKQDEEVFDKINPTSLNAHLKQFMEGLTAKVFRTYNASKTLQEELAKSEQSVGWHGLTPAQKVVEYTDANRQVAILCNHQKTVSKAQETQLEKISGKLATLKKQKKVLKVILKILNSGEKTNKIPLKKPEKAMVDAANQAVAKAKKMKEEAKTNAEKIAATEADEEAKLKKQEANDYKFTQAHLWEKIPSKDQVAKRIQTWTQRIAKMEMDLKHKDDNKEVSLGTSRINYMDPRISVAFCKRNDIPIEKIFSKTLRDKFNWAMAVEPDWEFNAGVAH